MVGKKAMDGVEEAVSFFPQGSAKAILRLLKRAQDKEVEAARRNIGHAIRSATKGGRLGSEIGRSFGRELAKAMSQRGAPKREEASIRQKAPDSGGRPFHFAYSVVTKADSAAAPSSRAAKAGSAAGHMRYIERETAVEVTARQPEVDWRAEGAEVGSRAAGTGRDRDDGSWMRERGGASKSRDDVRTHGPAPARDAVGVARETGDKTGQAPGGTPASGTAIRAGMEKADGTTVETEKGAEVRVKAAGAGVSARGGAPAPAGEPDQRDLEGEPALSGRATPHKALESEIDKVAKMHAARLFEHMRDGGAAHRQRRAEAGPKQGRVPTRTEAIAASRGISVFLKAVKDATDDVGQRMQIFASFARQPAALPARHESKDAVTMTGPAAAPQASEPASSAPSAMPQVQRKTAEPDRTAEDGAGRRDSSLGEDRVPIIVPLDDLARRHASPSGEVAARESSATVGARGEVPEPTQDGGPASSEADGRAPRLQHRAASKPFTMRIDEPVEMTALGAGAATSRSADPASVDSAGVDGAAVAAELPPSKPPQRRKTPEELEEEERRKKKRRAVLAKKKIRDRARDR